MAEKDNVQKSKNIDDDNNNVITRKRKKNVKKSVLTKIK